MRRLLGRGALELLWLTVRGEPVAALYGMAHGDKVYAYQTGRRTDVPAGVRPGGVLLAYAIRRAIEAAQARLSQIQGQPSMRTEDFKKAPE